MSRQRKQHPRTVGHSKQHQQMMKHISKRHLHAGSKLYKYRWKTIERLHKDEGFRAIDEYFAKITK